MTLVTNDGWSVSYTSGTGIDGVILKVFKFLTVGGNQYAKMRRGEADGLRFKNTDEATRYAHERGYLKPFVHAWCPRCQTRHTFLGKRSGFCPKHKVFC